MPVIVEEPVDFANADFTDLLNLPDSTFAETNEYVSPGSFTLKDEEVSFKNFPPTFITSGSGEILLDQIRTLVRRMQKDVGDKVIYYEADDVIHDFIGFPWQEPQRTITLKKIGNWMSDLPSES